MGIIMEVNKDIFLTDGDALGYLVRPMHKKCSMSLIWDHLFSTCGSYYYFFDPSRISFVLLCAQLEYHRLVGMWSHRLWSHHFLSHHFFLRNIYHFMTSHLVPSSLPWTSKGVFVNGGFKMLVVLPILIAEDLKGEILLWTATTVILTKFWNLVKKLQKQ